MRNGRPDPQMPPEGSIPHRDGVRQAVDAAAGWHTRRLAVPDPERANELLKPDA